MISRSSFLLRGSTSAFGEGVVSNHQRHNMTPLFSGESHPNGFDSLSTISVTFEAETGAFTQVQGTTPQLDWRLSNTSKLSQQSKDKLVRTKSRPRVSNETLEQGALKQIRGNENLFGEDVDQGLLLQFSKYQ